MCRRAVAAHIIAGPQPRAAVLGLPQGLPLPAGPPLSAGPADLCAPLLGHSRPACARFPRQPVPPARALGHRALRPARVPPWHRRPPRVPAAHVPLARAQPAQQPFALPPVRPAAPAAVPPRHGGPLPPTRPRRQAVPARRETPAVNVHALKCARAPARSHSSAPPHRAGPLPAPLDPASRLAGRALEPHSGPCPLQSPVRPRPVGRRRAMIGGALATGPYGAPFEMYRVLMSHLNVVDL